MTNQEAKMVERYFDEGYLIIIEDTSYVDSPVQSVFTNDDGELVYDSETFYERPLSEVDISAVIIAKPIKTLVVGAKVDPAGEPGEYCIEEVCDV